MRENRLIAALIQSISIIMRIPRTIIIIASFFTLNGFIEDLLIAVSIDAEKTDLREVS